tara:strand:- start:1957 stop:2247 length:291 start_codon:yes stop_codon:yes gene_type:complete
MSTETYTVAKHRPIKLSEKGFLKILAWTKNEMVDRIRNCSNFLTKNWARITQAEERKLLLSDNVRTSEGMRGYSKPKVKVEKIKLIAKRKLNSSVV